MGRANELPWKSLSGVMVVTAYSGIMLALVSRLLGGDDSWIVLAILIPMSLFISVQYLWPWTLQFERWLRGESDVEGTAPICPNCHHRRLQTIHRVGRQTLRPIGYRCLTCRSRIENGPDGRLIIEPPTANLPLGPLSLPDGMEVQFLDEVGENSPSAR